MHWCPPVALLNSPQKAPLAIPPVWDSGYDNLDPRLKSQATVRKCLSDHDDYDDYEHYYKKEHEHYEAVAAAENEDEERRRMNENEEEERRTMEKEFDQKQAKERCNEFLPLLLTLGDPGEASWTGTWTYLAGTLTCLAAYGLYRPEFDPKFDPCQLAWLNACFPMAI